MGQKRPVLAALVQKLAHEVHLELAVFEPSDGVGQIRLVRAHLLVAAGLAVGGEGVDEVVVVAIILVVVPAAERAVGLAERVRGGALLTVGELLVATEADEHLSEAIEMASILIRTTHARLNRTKGDAKADKRVLAWLQAYGGAP